MIILWRLYISLTAQAVTGDYVVYEDAYVHIYQFAKVCGRRTTKVGRNPYLQQNSTSFYRNFAIKSHLTGGVFLKKNLELVRAQAIVGGMFVLAGILVNGTRPWDIRVHDKRFYRRVLADGTLGFGESYMDGWWDCEAIDEMCFRAIRIRRDISLKLRDIVAVVRSFLVNRQSKYRSYLIGSYHYDLGNEFFEAMLDSAMQYSCAYFVEGGGLAEAQKLKMDLMCRKLGLQAGMQLLDIGCGWGGFARYAAQSYGCRVVGITVSKEQQQYAQQSCRGLPIEIRLEDYRDVSGSFDRIVSVGMMEHVGCKNYRRYMKVVHRCLKDGGLFLCHTICGNRPTLYPDPWMARYIFPNSMLPTAAQVSRAAEGLFVLEDAHNFGVDYDLTLRIWEKNFRKSWERFRDTYGERFYRMWRFYLLSCAGAFRARSLQLFQFVFSKGGVLGGYISRR